MNNLALPVMRLFFSIASLVAPKTTGLAAFRLFCTPPKPKTIGPNSSSRLASNAKLFESCRQWQLEHNNKSLMVYDFNDSADKTIVLVHGFHSRALFMAAFIQPLVEKGFRVIAFDLPAHGLSPGKKCHVVIGVAALQAVYEKTGPWHGVVAHSLGCVVVSTLLAGTVPKHRITCDMGKLVFISPPNSVPKLFETFIKTIGIKSKAASTFMSMINELSGRMPEDFMVAKQLREVGSHVLLLHAPDDKEIAFSESQAISDGNNLASLIPVAGEGHRRILASENTVQEATRFLTQ